MSYSKSGSTLTKPFSTKKKQLLTKPKTAKLKPILASKKTEAPERLKPILPKPTSKPVIVEKEISTKAKCPFAKIEEQILQSNSRLIRLERLMKNRKEETPQEFLIKFFDKWNDDRNTIFVEDKKLHTPLGKRRSLGDIFTLCKYYHPNTSLAEVIDLLYNILPRVMPSGFRSSWCGQTKKRMWYFAPKLKTEFYNSDHDDEFGKKADFYKTQLKKLSTNKGIADTGVAAT